MTAESATFAEGAMAIGVLWGATAVVAVGYAIWRKVRNEK